MNEGVELPTVPMADFNGGWNEVMETNGHPRVPTERVIRGYITSPRRDQQDEIVAEDLWQKSCSDGSMTRVEWLAKNGIIGFVHGEGPDGRPDVLHIGRWHRWRKVGGRYEFEGFVHTGSETIDRIWSVIKKYGTDAGFSIGGKPLEKIDCDPSGGGCTIADADVLEASWTPNPANLDASLTMVAMVKSMGPGDRRNGNPRSEAEREKRHGGPPPERGTGRKNREDDEMDKECGPKEKRCREHLMSQGHDEESAIRICRDAMDGSKGLGKTTDLLFSCKDCDDYVTQLVRKGRTASEAILKFTAILGAKASMEDEDVKNMTKKEEEENPKEEEEGKKSKKEEEDEEEQDQDDDTPPDDEGKKSKKSLEALTERIDALEKALRKMIDAKVTKSEEKPPETVTKTEDVEVYAQTEEQAIAKMVKAGFKVVGYEQATPDGVGGDNLKKSSPGGVDDDTEDPMKRFGRIGANILSLEPKKK